MYNWYFGESYGNFPPPDMLYALMYGTHICINDPLVPKLLKYSVFVNSLRRENFPVIEHWLMQDEGTCLIPLTSLATLYLGTSATRESDDIEESSVEHRPIEDRIRQLFDIVVNCTESMTGTHNFGDPLKALGLAWMPLKLEVAAAVGKQHVTVHDLLALGTNNIRYKYLEELQREEVQHRKILLPPPQNSIDTVRMTHSMNDPDNGTALFKEFNRIKLTSENPCRVLQSASGDCWDYALAFKSSDGKTPFVLFFSNKAGSDRAEKDKTIGELSTKQADFLRGVVGNWSSNGRGVGDAVAKGRYHYMYHTTYAGATMFKADRITVIGRDHTERYFKFMYPTYCAIEDTIQSRMEGKEQ